MTKLLELIDLIWKLFENANASSAHINMWKGMDNERENREDVAGRFGEALSIPWFALSKRRLVFNITGGGEQPGNNQGSSRQGVALAEH